MRLIKTIDVVCSSCGSSGAHEVGRARDFEDHCCDNEFLFVRCVRCGLVYLRNRPDISELDVIYGSNYVVYSYNEYLGGLISRLRGAVQRLKIAAVRKYAVTGSVIVDVGCGNAELLRLIKRFGDPSWRLIGVDLAKEALEHLSRLGIEGIEGRFEALDWPGPRPHVIIMNQVIEHFEDPRGAVRRAFEILEPGGILIVETPSMDGWDAHLFKTRYWGGWHTPRHWNIYTEATLGTLLRAEGFEIAEVTYLLNPYAWLQSLRFLVEHRLGMPRLARVFQVNVLPSLAAASMLDVFQRAVRRKTSNIRMVGRRPVPAASR